VQQRHGAVEEGLELGGDAEDENGAGEHQGVGGAHLAVERGHVVLDGAGFPGQAQGRGVAGADVHPGDVPLDDLAARPAPGRGELGGQGRRVPLGGVG